MVKLQYDGNGQFKITLPKQVMKAKKWKGGDEISVELNDTGDIVLKNETKTNAKA